MQYFTCFRLAGLLALLARPAPAQTLNVEWATTSGGLASSTCSPVSLTTDAQGNTYVTGRFSGTITLGSTTLTAVQTYPGNTGASDTFLAKLDAQGQYLWAIQLGDGQDDSPSTVVVDNMSNVYITGSFSSYSLEIGSGGPILYNSSANSEGFIARFSGQTGACQWARRFGGTGSDIGRTLVVNAAGEIFLAGNIGSGVADLGSFTFMAAQSLSSTLGFLAKLNAAGTWLWAQQLGSTGQVLVSGLALDGQNGLYLSGTVASPGVTLGSTTLVQHALVRAGNGPGYDVVVAKYTKTGSLMWAVQGDPTGENYVGYVGNNALASDGQGHLYVAGSYAKQVLHIGNFTLPNASLQTPQPNPAPPAPYTDNYYTDAYVARLDAATGTWQWAVRKGSSYIDGVSQPVIDGQGRLLVLAIVLRSCLS